MSTKVSLVNAKKRDKKSPLDIYPAGGRIFFVPPETAQERGAYHSCCRNILKRRISSVI